MKNIEIAQRYLNAAYSGDIETVKTLLDKHIILTINGNNAVSGVSVGIDPFLASFGKCFN